MWTKNWLSPLIPDLSKYDVVAEPPKPVEDFWAGAPSVIEDSKGVIWLAYRKGIMENSVRKSDLYLARSEDGINFETIHEWKAESFGCIRTERASFLVDPWTKQFKLYITRDALEKPPGTPEFQWDIAKLADVDSPAKFDISTVVGVLGPSGSGSDGRDVKDPYVFTLGNKYYMFYIAAGKTHEQCHMATSDDGILWRRHTDNPILRHGAWHDFFVRPSFVLPQTMGAIVYYEGSNKQWYGPVFNVQTGFAITFDFQNFYDITISGPVLSSPTQGKYGTCRYMDCIVQKNRVLFYYEAARPDDAFELRVTEIGF